MPIHPHDELLEQLGGQAGVTPPPAPRPAANPYERILAQDETRRRDLRRATAVAFDNPDRAAQVLRLAAETGLAPATVERNFDAIDRRRRRRGLSFDALLDETPTLSRWMAASPFHAALATDDLEALSELERTLRFGTRAARALGAGVLGFSQGIWGALQATAELQATGRIPQILPGDAASTAGLAQFAGETARAAEALASTVRGPQAGAGFIERGVLSGIESVGQMAPGLLASVLTASPAPMLGMAGVTTGGQAFGEARGQGVTLGRAATFASLQGAIEVATELIPARLLIGDVVARAPFLQSLAKQVAGEIPGEQVATVLQDLNAWATLPVNADKPFRAYLIERPSAAAATLIATITAAGLQTSAGHATARLLERVGTSAEQSATARRARDQFERLIEQATADTPLADVHLPLDTFEVYWQEQGEDPAEVAARLTGSREAYRAAQTTGDLVVPTARYVTEIARTEHNAFFKEEARFAPGEMNGREAAAFTAEQDAQLAAEPTEPAAPTAAEATRAGILTNVTEQLTRVGFEGRTAAAIAEAFGGIAQLAERAGVDPQGMVDELGLRITRPEVGTAAETIPPAGAPIAPAGDTIPATRETFAQEDEIPTLEILSPEDATAELNASGESAASLEALRRQAGMRARNETFVVYDRTGRRRPLIGPDAVDYHARPGETFGVEGQRGFQVLEERGGRVPASARPLGPRVLFHEDEAAPTDPAPEVVLTKAQRAVAPAEPTTIEAIRAAVEVHYRTLKRATVPGLGEVLIGNKGLKKAFDHAARPKLRALVAVREILQQGRVGPRQPAPDRRDGIVAFHPIEARVRVGDQVLDVIAFVGEHAEGLTFYELGVKRAMAPPRPGVESQGPGPSRSGEPPLEDSLPVRGQTVKRGAIFFGPGDTEIRLLPAANLATVLHELGHFYFQILSDLAVSIQAREGETLTEAQTESQRQLVADYQTLLGWFGITQPDQLTRAHQEQFARGFEAYLREGKAPSPELRGAFGRFRAWLGALYRSLRDLGPDFVPLNDEVRAVFDRLLATDEAIAAARADLQLEPIVASAEDAAALGIPPEIYAAYRAQIVEASIAQRETLERRLLGQYQREQQRWWKAQRRTMRAAVAADVHQQPVYRALAAIRRGRQPDGTPIGDGAPMRLDKAALVALFGEAALPRLRGLYRVENGLTPDQAAELFGFTSGDQLVRALIEAPPMATLIDQLTDARMRAEHGDLLLDGSLVDRAREAVLGEHRDDVVRAELRALVAAQRQAAPAVRVAEAEGEAAVRAAERERAYERRWLEAEAKLRIAIAEGRKQAEIDVLRSQLRALEATRRGAARAIEGAIPPAATLRQLAQDRIAQTRVRDLQPERYWAAARRASKAATRAAAQQDVPAAIAAKQQELVNLALYRKAQAARDEVGRIRQTLRRFTQAPARTRLAKAGREYLEQIDGILARYDLATVPFAQLDRRQTLADWIAAREAAGLPVDLPQEVRDEARRINYRDVSLDELRGVHDAVRQIAFFARQDARVGREQAKQQLDAVAAEMAARIRANAPGGARPAPIGMTLPHEDARRGLAGFFAWQRKLSSLIRQMDGGQDGGPVWEHLMRRINDAADRETAMKEEAAVSFAELLAEAYTRAELVDLSVRRVVPGIGASMTRSDLVVLALHWGNEGNRQRILSREGWTAEQVRAALDTLTERDWVFVRGVWTRLQMYWPLIVAKQQRVYGLAPEPVEASLYETRFGTMPGGYFPIKYNPARDERAFAHSVEELAAQMMRGAIATATTRRGFTQARQEQVTRPVRFDFGVIWEHLSEVIHDVTHHEMLIDVQRLLRHEAVSTAIRESFGMPVYREMVAAVRDIAAGDVPVHHQGERALEWMRQGTSIARMGWNLMTSAVQPLGLTVSVRRIGVKWVAKGMARWLGDATRMESSVRWVHALSPFMRLRHKTLMREINEIKNTIAPRGSFALAAIGGTVAGTAGAELGHATTSTYAAIEDTYFWFVSRMQMVADIPTWLGAYEKAMADPAHQRADGSIDEARVVAIADQAVIDAQGSGHIKDLARAQRGTPALKLFTQFMGYFSVVFNQGAEVVGKFRVRKDPAALGRLAVDLLMLYTVPMVLELAIRDALAGDDDDDRTLARKFAEEQAAYALSTIVFAREIAGGLAGYRYRGPAGASIFADLNELVRELANLDFDEGTLKSLNQVGGVLFHYPSTQVERLVRAAIAAEQEGAAAAFQTLFGRRPEN